MKKQGIPKQIQNILTEDEIIEKRFNLKGCQVYSTNNRLLVLEGRTIRDFDYAHISSIAYSSRRYWWLIGFGIIFIIAGVYIRQIVGVEIAAIAGGLIGLILIIAGAVSKSEWIEANVVGVTKPRTFKGSRDNLDSLLQIIRQKQPAETFIGETEAKVVDFTETIRKLAELRDDGIITQEEFEQKKSQLLRDSK